jgi:hypothetical protein
MAESFTCAQCGLVYPRISTHEDMMTEARETFSPAELAQEGGMVELCDDCYEAFMVWLAAHPEMRIQ